MKVGMRQQSEELLNTRNEGGVVRVGDTVRRPTGPWTPTVHALLGYLHESGFGFAPRPLGIDEAGREVLTYIDGDTEMTPVSRRVRFNALPEAARRLRRLHDLTASFAPSDGAIWRDEDHGNLPGLRRPPFDDARRVICHGDWGTHNAVFRNGRLVGMFDWDFARPEHPLYDIGWLALWWCPIGPPDVPNVPVPDRPAPVDQPARLRQLCDAYGLQDRGEVLWAVRDRLETFIEWLETGAAAGDAPRQTRVDAGEGARHRRSLEYLNEAHADFAAALR